MTLTAADKIEIQELSNRYANAMDDGDIETWLSTWTADGSWEGGPGRYEGLERLKQLLPDLGERIVGKRHVMTNFVIEGDGENASQRCYLLIVDASRGMPPGTAVYHDTLRKINGQWRFQTRKVAIDQPAAKK